jgi:hypothetical protein
MIGDTLGLSRTSIAPALSSRHYRSLARSFRSKSSSHRGSRCVLKNRLVTACVERSRLTYESIMRAADACAPGRAERLPEWPPCPPTFGAGQVRRVAGTRESARQEAWQACYPACGRLSPVCRLVRTLHRAATGRRRKAADTRCRLTNYSRCSGCYHSKQSPLPISVR